MALLDPQRVGAWDGRSFTWDLLLVTMLISQEDSGIGLVMRRAPTSKEAVPLAAGQCAHMLESMRHPLTTYSAQAALP